MSEWDTTDDFSGGGNYLDKPGTYHLMVSNVKDGLSSKDKPMDGFTAEMIVLGGTVPGQEGRKVDIAFFQPNPTKSEASQQMSRRLNTAFFIATNILDPNLVGKRLSIDPVAANGQQCVIKLVHGQEKDELGNYVDSDKFLRVNYSDVWHVDDPACKDVPKSAESLGLIGKQLRCEPTWFDFKKKKKGETTKQTASVGASKSDDFDDI